MISLISDFKEKSQDDALINLNEILDELSQPICACNINIQFLRHKLNKRELTSELNKEALESIDIDLQRVISTFKLIRSKYFRVK